MSIGFIKNKYIGRTFIAPGQKIREDKVQHQAQPHLRRRARASAWC